MEYAIVDIETTGGNATNGGSIIEIAIRVFDGYAIVASFDSLVKPIEHIPPFITAMTGIDDAMIQDSPVFSDIAMEVFSMLNGRIFVAHNVNFDYSFIRHHLAIAGYQYKASKLCTIQLSRAIRPGLLSYSLGKLCDALEIELKNRHRAGGDADATVLLFQQLLQWDSEGVVPAFLERGNIEPQVVPDTLRDDFEQVPNKPGVYYFHNDKGQAIYVGKANDLKKRVAQHFKRNNGSRLRQSLISEIASISYEVCGTELMALILEALEIKRLFPKYNQALKKYDAKYGLFVHEDPKGYLRMKISKLGKNPAPVQVFTTHQGGIGKLRELSRRFGLCASLCRLSSCELCSLVDKKNNLLCTANHSAEVYNEKVMKALSFLKEDAGTFYIIDKGRNSNEKSCLWVENGHFYGMGYIDNGADIFSLDDIKSSLTSYASSHYVMQLVISFICRYPKKVVSISNKSFAYQ